MTTVTLQHTGPLSEASAPRPSWLKRFFTAMMEARMRQAERELALHRHLIPQDALKDAGYTATQSDDSTLPFVR